MIPRTAIPISNQGLLSVLFSAARSHSQETAGLEKEIADYLRSGKVFAVNSGRTALFLALRALGLKAGESVIVPAYTCAIVFETVLRLGLNPALVDVNPQTYNMDPSLIPKAITSKTRAIIPVHLFGRPCEMNQIMDIAREYNLFVIEDVAQALGAEYKGKKAGVFGDLAIFSFGPGKSITSGEGGALAVNNEELTDEVAKIKATLTRATISWDLHVIRNIISMRIFSNHRLYALIRNNLEDGLNRSDLEILRNCIELTKMRDADLYPTIEIARMPSLSAKIARAQLRRIDELNNRRLTNADYLTRRLTRIATYVQLPKSGRDLVNTFTRYPVRLKRDARERVKNELLKRGIDVETPYHYLTSFIHSYSRKRYPHTTEICQNLLTIPVHPCLTSEDLGKVARALIEISR